MDTFPARHARGADDLRQRSQGANGLPRHARRGRLHRVPLLRNACRIARRVGIASSCRQKTRPHRHGIAGGGDRTHPDIRRSRPRTQPAAAIESRTAGQLQRGDVVHLFRSLRALHENRSGDPFPPLFDLRRGHRRRERHRTERILRRVDGPIPDDGRRRSRKIPGFGSRLDRTGGDGSHVRFRHFGLQ